MRVFVLIFCLMYLFSMYAGRTVHRYYFESLPRITVWSSKDPTPYNLIDQNLRPVPLMLAYDQEHFMKHLLPQGNLEFLDKTGSVDTAVLQNLIQGLLAEIKRGEIHYKDFIVLKKSNFIRQSGCGLIILKFKDYPFILKLFIESPAGFVNPYAKGFEAANFFIAGGAQRHTLGFTRIKTLEYVQHAIAQDERWKDRITFPRKWFWLPKEPEWLFVRLDHLGVFAQTVKIPAIYALVADELFKDPEKETDYRELMAFSKFVEHRIDPHTKNFFIQKGEDKIALIDTELFPMILGFTEQVKPRDTHVKWYLYLAGKYTHERLFTTKGMRIKKQQSVVSYYL